MIFIQWPLMLCALVPVIVIEALLIRRWIALSYREAFPGCAVANAFSTFLGVPLAWTATFAIEVLVMMPVGLAAAKWHSKLDATVFQALGFLFSIAWLAPVERHLHWMVPSAVALLLIPCFYVSVWLEWVCCRRMWPSQHASAVGTGVFRVNLASYVLLFLLASGWVAFSLFTELPRL